MDFPCTTDPFVILVAIRGIHGPRLRISLCPPRCCPPGTVAHGDTLFSGRITLNPNSGPALVGALLYRALLPQRLGEELLPQLPPRTTFVSAPSMRLADPSVGDPPRFSRQSSSTHSQTLPSMSYSPQAFGSLPAPECVWYSWLVFAQPYLPNSFGSVVR